MPLPFFLPPFSQKLINVYVSRIAVSPKGNCYASGGEDGFVRVHHFDEGYFKAKPYGDIEIIN